MMYRLAAYSSSIVATALIALAMLAVTRGAVVGDDGETAPAPTKSFFCFWCSQPNCATSPFACQCASPARTCQDMFGSTTDCECEN